MNNLSISAYINYAPHFTELLHQLTEWQSQNFTVGIVRHCGEIVISQQTLKKFYQSSNKIKTHFNKIANYCRY